MSYFIATLKEEDWAVVPSGEPALVFPLIVKAASLDQACDIIRYRMKITLSDIDAATLKVAELKEMGSFSFDNKHNGIVSSPFVYTDDNKPSHGGSFNVLLRTEQEIKDWEKQVYPWVDYSSYKYSEDYAKCNKYIAVRNEAAHKSIAFMKPIHSKGLEHIDGDDWELFHSDFTVKRDGKLFYYGMFVEGIGAINVMVAEENMRDLTPEEKKTFSGKTYGMYGSHSGNLSYTTTLPEIK